MSRKDIILISLIKACTTLCIEFLVNVFYSQPFLSYLFRSLYFIFSYRRDKKSVYKKDYDEFIAFDGPLGFRDKSPPWIDDFSAGIWEEKTTVSRRAARAFGTYRKAMRLVDSEVVLQPCDE